MLFTSEPHDIHTEGPVKHGRLIFFSVYCSVLFKVAYTGQITFYKVPEDHDHVYEVTLYVYTLINQLLEDIPYSTYGAPNGPLGKPQK